MELSYKLVSEAFDKYIRILKGRKSNCSSLFYSVRDIVAIENQHVGFEKIEDALTILLMLEGFRGNQE